MTRYLFLLFSLATALAGASALRAEDAPPAKRAQSKFPCDTEAVAQYTAGRIHETIKVDGKLDEECWKKARRSPRFVDIITGKPTMYNTEVAVVWDDQNLYVGYWVEEPDVKATLKNHNDPIYYDNDVEFFIAGRDVYYEFEINAFNTVYEVLFIWQDSYDKVDYAKDPALERSKMAGFNGVGFTTHPRGPRLGSWHWRFPGMQTAVHINGTLNNDKDKDKGWTVELAFPWEGMKWLAKADGRALPPKNGDEWRIDFSRFNQYKAPAPAKDSGGWFLSPHGIWDSHIPECFPRVTFSTNDAAQITIP